MTPFAYHWGAAALVFIGPDGHLMGIPTATLRAWGFLADDAVMRTELPRADAGRIETMPDPKLLSDFAAQRPSRRRR